VSVQRFNDAPFFRALSPLPSSPLQMSSYAIALPQPPALRSGGTNVDAEWPAETIVNAHDLGKGVSWALAIEAAAALAICVVWRLWHFL